MASVELSDGGTTGARRGGRPSLAATARPLALGGLVLAFFGFCYADVLKTLWIQWNTNEANSHGFLIPWISLYVLWVRRERLAALRPVPVWWAGLLVLVPSLAVLLVGRLVGIVGLQEASLVGSLLGLVLLLVGWRGLDALWFPIGYLLFMMPIWDLATEPMYYPLQLFAATLGTRILTLVGVPIFQDGTFLHLPNMSFEVAFACSGINFLMSVLAIGILLAYLSLDGLWRRFALLTLAVVVGLLANPVRVAIIVYSSYSGIGTPQQGHMWQGMVVSVGAFAVLFAVAARLETPRQPALPSKGPEPDRVAAERHRFGLKAAFALSCSLLVVCGFSRPLILPEFSIAQLHLAQVPLVIGEWRAQADERPELPDVGRILPDELWREYRAPSGGTQRLYVGRFVHAPQGQRGVSYWSENFGSIVADSGPGNRPRTLPMNTAKTVGKQPGTSVFYWYRLGNYQTTNRVAAKLYAAWCALTGAETGPVAVVIFAADDAGHGDAGMIAAREFARDVADALSKPGRQ